MRRSQEDRSSSTKAALVAAARELFTARGYHAVPADEIVRAAGVSRGALYHHYADKQGLFRAVFEQLEQEVAAEVAAALRAAPDFASAMLTALGAFLDACARDDVRRVGLVDAPAVLGWRTWRAIEREHGLGLVIEALEQATAQEVLTPQPVRVLAQLILSAVVESALLIADAEDPAGARAQVEQALGAWLTGLLSPS